MVAGGLALLFPFRSLEEKIGRAAPRPDALQIAYLESWLTVRPDRGQLRYLLAQQLLVADDLARARAHLARLAASPDPGLRNRALLLELDVAIRELQALPPGHPDRPSRMLALRERFRALLALDLPVDVGMELARRADALGAAGIALDWYERLLERAPALPAVVWETAAERTLQRAEHSLAARLYMQARAAATSVAERRRLFLAGLRALQAVSRLDEALDLADRNLGALATDTETLEFLTRLALAANRPAIAQRYAAMLLRISLLPEAIERMRHAGRAIPVDWLELRDRIAARAMAAQAVVAPDAARAPHLPFDAALYRLSFDVFVANGNLRDALAVARAAVRQVPHDLAWRRRLAQTADWAGEPELALEQWHAIARRTGDDDAWAQVRRRAAQLRDTARWLEALQVARSRRPGDTAAVLELADAYEELGRPEEALALLRPALDASERSAARRLRLERLAAIAERSGDIATQRAALQALMREFEPQPDVALRLAGVEYAAGDYAAAFAALEAARSRAEADAARHREYWRAYAELARASGRRDEALRAYRLLLDLGTDSEDALVGAAGLLEEDDPREAARLYDLAWQRLGRPDLATQALYLLLRAGDPAAVRRWLTGLTSGQLEVLERDARFLIQRASFALDQGDARAAAGDARRALVLQPSDAAIEALLVWALIAARDAPALRALLRESARRAADELLLWGPFAAGWLTLQEPRQALRYLRKQAAASGDYLWMLSYADALDQLGQGDLAWNVRRHAWLERDAMAAAARTPQQRLELERRLVPLAVTLAGGDAARARLVALLAADPQAGAGPTREVALAYWISRERSDLAKAWLLGQYAQSLARPAWAELSVALGDNDAERIETLLDTAADWLPIYDRIEAAHRVGRTAQAQTFAFDTLNALPASDEVHRRFVDRVAGDRADTASSFAGAGVRGFKQSPIDATTVAAEGQVRLSQRLLLGAAFAETWQRSTNAAQLVDPPRHDTAALVEFAYDLGPSAAARFSVQQRDALARQWGWLARGEWSADRRLTITASAGQGQPATDTAYLRVGGERDLLGVTATSRFSQREFASVGLEVNRFAAQGDGGIGDGRVLRIEAGHYFRTEYPDFSVRLAFADLDYSPSPGIAPAMLPLLPPPARPGATNALLLPVSTVQFSVALVAGETARDRYTRGWRPFGVLSATQDRESGSSYAWALGAAGSIFGADELSLLVAAGSGLGVQITPFRQIAVRYRWLF